MGEKINSKKKMVESFKQRQDYQKAWRDANVEKRRISAANYYKKKKAEKKRSVEEIVEEFVVFRTLVMPDGSTINAEWFDYYELDAWIHRVIKAWYLTNDGKEKMKMFWKKEKDGK